MTALTPYPVFGLAFRHDVTTFYGRVIARVAGGPVHVACVFGTTAIEAREGTGVRQITTSALLASGDWTVVHVPHGDAAAALLFARRELGAKYDWLGVLWSWMVGRHGGNGSKRRWSCSEFAAAVLAHSGNQLGVKRHAYYTPARLWRAVGLWERVRV